MLSLSFKWLYMNINTGNNSSLTLHIRITKKCNADCTYCSSFQTLADNRMSLDDLDKSLTFLSQLILNKNIGGTREMISVQYVGGEVSVLPLDYVEEYTKMVEQRLAPLFKYFQHGVQSNLIASKDKIIKLVEIFGTNIGTSFDNSTDQRRVQGDSSKYRTIFLKNQTTLKKIIGKKAAGVVVIDEKMEPFVFNEIDIANKNNTHLTLRPVFQGGMPIEEMNVSNIIPIFEKAFDDWIMNSHISIEPFTSLLNKRLIKHKKSFISNNGFQEISAYSGCPFQHNCAQNSLNLEPNGDLFLCFEMADGNRYSFGNAINGDFNEETYNLLLERSNKLQDECYKCDYFNECQGGCMNEAIDHFGDIYAKTKNCSLWKAIFRRIDYNIEKYGVKNIQSWLENNRLN